MYQFGFMGLFAVYYEAKGWTLDWWWWAALVVGQGGWCLLMRSHWRDLGRRRAAIEALARWYQQWQQNGRYP